MNAGLLSDKIVFEARVITVNANEQNDITWSAARADGGFEDMAEVERQSEQNCRFVIRYRQTSAGAELSGATHRILFDGCIWTITNSVHDRRRTQLTIDSDFSALIEVTHMLSTEREYIQGVPIIRPPE